MVDMKTYGAFSQLKQMSALAHLGEIWLDD